MVSSLPARKALAAVSLKGLVKSAYGEPVREGNVTFSRDGVSMKAVTLENDGTFSASLVPGQYRILVSSPIWGGLIADHEVLREDAVLDLMYEATAVVEGRIIGGAADLTAVCHQLGMDLHGPLEPESGPGAPLRSRVAVDCAARSFVIDELGPGEFLLSGAYRWRAVELSFRIERNGERKRIELDLDTKLERSFRGRALLENEPLASADLNMSVQNGAMKGTKGFTTGSDGRFELEFPLMGWGACLQFYRSPDRKPVRIRYDSRARAGEERDIDFEDSPGRRGIVINQDGAPIPYVRLDFKSAKSSQTLGRETNAEGAFSANDLDPGQYAEFAVHSIAQASPLTIPEPEETFIVEVDVQRVLLVSVKARDEEIDWYASRLYPVLRPAEVGWIPLLNISLVKPEITPRTFVGLKPEAYVMEALSPLDGWGRGVADLSSGSRELTIRLVPPREIEIPIVDGSGAPWPRVNLSVPGFAEHGYQFIRLRSFGPPSPEPEEPPGSPFVQVIQPVPPNLHRFRVYPGEGSRVKLWASSEENAVVLDADDLLERSVLVLE